MKRNYLKLYTTAILTLSTLLSISFFTACHEPDPQFIPVGEARVVGTMDGGQVALAETEDPAGQYLIVTRAFVLKAANMAMEIRQLRLELKLCREGKQ
jgi:hypothetical protein